MSSALYRFTVPPTSEQGSHVGTCRASLRETYRQNALSDYNSARAHDGLPPLARMPRGTSYRRLTVSESIDLHPPRSLPGWAGKGVAS